MKSDSGHWRGRKGVSSELPEAPCAPVPDPGLRVAEQGKEELPSVHHGPEAQVRDQLSWEGVSFYSTPGWCVFLWGFRECAAGDDTV